MLARRSINALIAASAFLIAAPPLIDRARAQPGPQAVMFVKSTAEQLVAIVSSTDTPIEKRAKLQKVISATVDVDDIAHFCLGRFSRLATPEQQREYLGLFRDLLATKIAGHLGEYRGVRVTMGLAREVGDTEIVATMVDRPNNPTYQIDWVVSTASGGPKIVDLLAEGTSMRLTQGNDFAAYLARHQYNIHELVDGMRQLIALSG
jgi:phospholipid transport system substrate-binding protein